MKVLVVGGTGFVGSHTARALAAAGHEVAVLTRPTSPRRALTGLEVEWVAGDLRAPESLLAACRGRDAVVHTAGVLSLWRREAEALYRTNVLGTRHLLEACLAAGVGRVVWDGSVGIYAGTRSPVPVDERGADTTDRFHSFHVTSMCLAEAEVWKAAARGLDVVCLHPGLCVGEDDRSWHSSWAIAGLAFARLPFAPPGGLNLVDVLDVARAHVLALERAPRGGNYLIGGENLTNRALVDLLREVLDLRAPALPISRATMRGFGQAGEWLARLRGADRGLAVTLNAAMGEAMSLYWFVDDARARRELGHGPGPVRPALERQVRWLLAQGHLPQSGFGLRDFVERFFQPGPSAG